MGKSTLVNFKVLISGVAILRTSFETVIPFPRKELGSSIHEEGTVLGMHTCGLIWVDYHQLTLWLESFVNTIYVFPSSKLWPRNQKTPKGIHVSVKHPQKGRERQRAGRPPPRAMLRTGSAHRTVLAAAASLSSFREEKTAVKLQEVK